MEAPYVSHVSDLHLRIPDDLPQVIIGILKIAGVAGMRHIIADGFSVGADRHIIADNDSLGVRDGGVVPRARRSGNGRASALRFYRDGLGLPTQGIVGAEFEHGAVAFFDLQPGLQLAIWKRDDIAHDASTSKTAHGPTELTIGHNVGSKEEVDAVTRTSTKSWRKTHEVRRRYVLGRLRGSRQIIADSEPPHHR